MRLDASRPRPRRFRCCRLWRARAARRSASCRSRCSSMRPARHRPTGAIRPLARVSPTFPNAWTVRRRVQPGKSPRRHGWPGSRRAALARAGQQLPGQRDPQRHRQPGRDLRVQYRQENSARSDTRAPSRSGWRLVGQPALASGPRRRRPRAAVLAARAISRPEQPPHDQRSPARAGEALQASPPGGPRRTGGWLRWRQDLPLGRVPGADRSQGKLGDEVAAGSCCRWKGSPRQPGAHSRLTVVHRGQRHVLAT